MEIIVPCNNKGGVGKTFVTSLIAEYLSIEKQKKTLVIDLDPQCNISQRYLKMQVNQEHTEGHMPPIHHDYDSEEDVDWDGISSSADIFLSPEKGIVPYGTMEHNLDILPGHARDLQSVEMIHRGEIKEKIHDRLQFLFSLADVQAEYDYIVIDTAPSKGPLTTSAMRSATNIIIPCQMEDKSIRGAISMMQLWKKEDALLEEKANINLIGILPNMVDPRTTLHKQFLDYLVNHDHLGKVTIPHFIKRRTAYAENDTENALPKSIFDHRSTNESKKEALETCGYIFDKIVTSNRYKTKEEEVIA